jgi:predicted enzyme related to lactoylglutathione lyase
MERVTGIGGVFFKARREGVEVDPRIEEGEYGRFAWVMEPEANRISLWEPPE